MKDPNQNEAFENALANLQYVLIARRVQASDEPMRLNWRHFDIMAFIKEHESVEPSKISKTLYISRSSTSKYLKSLEEKALILKTAQGSDRRSHQVVLTKHADEILENIYRGQRENALQALQVLSDEEIQQFTTIATKIASALDSDQLHIV